MSKRVKDNLDRGLWAEYGVPEDGYIARACKADTNLWANDPPHFMLFYFKEALPAFNREDFYDYGELIVAMRKVETDLRKWRLCEADLGDSFAIRVNSGFDICQAPSWIFELACEVATEQED